MPAFKKTSPAPGLDGRVEQSLRSRLDTLDRPRLIELCIRLARERPELADWMAVAADVPAVSAAVKRRVQEQQALAKEARRKRFLAEDVRLLLGGRERRLAEDLIVARAAELDGGDFAQLTLLCAEAEQEGAWLIAVLVRRAMLDDILATSRANAYPVGAKHLRALRLLDERIDDYRGVLSHVEYEARLHLSHDHKTSFWDKVRAVVV